MKLPAWGVSEEGGICESVASDRRVAQSAVQLITGLCVCVCICVCVSQCGHVCRGERKRRE